MIKPRLQHVSLLVPLGAQEAVRAFYGHLIGLKEKLPPQSLAEFHVVWFIAGPDELELHFVPSADRPGENDQHICLEVDDLQIYRHRLEEAGIAIIDDVPIPFRPRFFCHDPFGNLIEFTALQGNYSAEQEQL